MDNIEKVEDVIRSVSEHTRAVREFKYDMSMKYHNALSQRKRDEIVTRVEKIADAMFYIKDVFRSDYIEFEKYFKDTEVLNKLGKFIKEFTEEIEELR